MPAELLAYDCVPLGFEVVIKNTDVEMGRIWNLWHNIKLTDDPQSWDSEILRINRMQGRLGKLTTDQRLIRAHMAEFCRVCPLFPRSIDILCEEIGQDHFSNPVLIGCEGRDLLHSLGYHDQVSLSQQRTMFLTWYSESLAKWLQGGNAETPTDFKVFGFLGKTAEGKTTLAKDLISIISSPEPSVASLRRLAEDTCKETQKEPIDVSNERYRGRPFNCFGCLPQDTTKCQCCYSMLPDASLLCTGTSGEGRSMLGEFKRFTEENILAYSAAINSWLTGQPMSSTEWPSDAQFVPKYVASSIVESVHASLGEKNGVKEWLVTCLLKTIKDNQRWHKGTELVDGHPEATSYIRDLR